MPLKESLNKIDQRRVYKLFEKGAPVEYIAKQIKATRECVERFTPKLQDAGSARAKKINDAALKKHTQIMDSKNNPVGAMAEEVAKAVSAGSSGPPSKEDKE